MCGIVGACSKRNVAAILLDGLKRLEYRGYDSAGMAIIDADGEINRLRKLGKVSQLETALEQQPLTGNIGIAHTRWATHGCPSEHNAHPHVSHDELAIVHNGIIENHEYLREKLVDLGYQFHSETDTEVIAHLIHYYSQQTRPLFAAVQAAVAELDGAYALGVLHREYPDQIIAVRKGSPLVVGLGFDENFIASDSLALLPVAQKFIYLQDGDVAIVKQNDVVVFDIDGVPATREIKRSKVQVDSSDKGQFRHYMQKEIFEQSTVLQNTLEGRLGSQHIYEEAFGDGASRIFDQVKQVQIVACGTSYHAGMIARYWLEEFANIPCQVEVASEFRYRKHVVNPGTLFVTISQSGETADTLAALQQAKSEDYLASLVICNVPESSLVRESDLVFMTRAGAEIGVASTKAFTTQLVALLLLTLVLAKRHSQSIIDEQQAIAALRQLPEVVADSLELDQAIQDLAESFADKNHALFLGRGAMFPVALEGALKLKEISYIHAEAYPAGELKHGPLALVDKHMPVITVAPNDDLLEKLKSNLYEVRARGGELIVFADSNAQLRNGPGVLITDVPSVDRLLVPIVYTIPLQLLAYHVALIKGTDVDQPRNLAKSVTVE